QRARRQGRFDPADWDFDELELIKDMIDAPGKYFTSRLDDLADEHVRNAALRGERDPTMRPGVARNRRLKSQAEFLGLRDRRLRPKPDPETGEIPRMRHDPPAWD